MDEDLFCAIAFFKFRWTDELSKVGQKNPNSFELDFFRDSERRVYWDTQLGPSLIFFFFLHNFNTYLNNIISIHLQSPPEGLSTEGFWDFFFKHKVGHYLLISFPKLMHRLNGLEKYKKQEQTDFYHNNSGYDSNKSSLFPKHSHYHNNDSLGRTQMNVLSYLGN